ncbi:FUSC family protein [Granulicoccus sp. GXG6511]|uniref:FUSC family protein n=1 Tax=Granulicoccus sp. GXG6511 TaxID=3381351 RepID=UPI003D7DD5E3
MDRFSLQRLRLRAFDLSERSFRFGRAAQRRGVERWRNRIWMISQQALAAGLAWLFAQQVLGHSMPVFAAIAAILTLGSSFGQRLGRATEVALGVALGVFFGDLFVLLFDRGWWQIIVVVVLAMSVAIFLRARDLMVTQAGVQAVVVVVMPLGDTVFTRWIDALIGCALALLIALVAPTGPIRKPSDLAAGVLNECAAVLDEVHSSVVEEDLDAGDRVLERARAVSDRMQGLDEAAAEGLAVVRYSPFLRRNRSHMVDLVALTEPLDRLTRNVRVLARRAAVAIWHDEKMPDSYLELMELVALEMRACARELAEGQLPVDTRARVIELGTTHINLELVDEISSIVILAQLRSILVDLLEVTGMTYADARDALPDRH